MKKIYESGIGICQIPKKLMLVMKLTAILLVVFTMHVTATVYSQNTKLSLNMQKASIKEVLQQIEAQSEYRFIYENEKVNLDSKVSIEVKDEIVENILKELFEKDGVSYSITESNMILINPSEKQMKSLNKEPINSQQQKTIKGTVKSSTGEPLPGVTVSVKGTTMGNITDNNGNYSISNLPENAVLVFSFIGMKTQEIKVGPMSVINVVMAEETVGIDEVVAIGYGVQKKSVVTAAISKVSAEDLAKQVPTRIEDVLKGHIAGVQITSNSGQPGAASMVRVRGVGTVNNSDPLFIVDGMPINGGIEYLNPSDIASVEVLKDAASGAIYGARAANGVILVTTKSGEKGKTIVQYNFSYGIQNPWKRRELLNSTQYETLMSEALSNADMPNTYTSPGSTGINTDWQKEIINKNAPIVNHNASISGGNQNGKYFISFGYLNQEGIVGKDKSGFERYNFRSNIEYNLYENKDNFFFRKVTFGTNIGYTFSRLNGIDENSNSGGPLFAATNAAPNMPVFETDEATIAQLKSQYDDKLMTDKNGNMYKLLEGQAVNPMALLSTINNNNKDHRLLGAVWAEIELIRNLKLRSSYSTDLLASNIKNWTPAYFLSIDNRDDNSRINNTMNINRVWSFENTLSYSLNINKNNLTVLAGSSAQKTINEDVWGKNQDLIGYYPGKDYLDFASGSAEFQFTGGGAYIHTLASLFGRVSYNYDEKYMAEMTIRRDGSSNFPVSNQYATFPSVSLGWNLHKESFLQNVKGIDQLKLRASWGMNGNEAIGAFQYTSLIQTGDGYKYVFGPSKTYVGVGVSRLANDALKWEASEQYDLGIDGRFFGSRLSATLDWFYKKTSDMLMIMPVPALIGNGAPDANVGSMKNTGIEFDFGYQDKIGKLKYKVNGNASYVKNEVLGLGVEKIYNFGYTGSSDEPCQRHTVGQPFAHFLGAQTNGIFQNQAQIDAYKNNDGELYEPNALPGDVIFVDVNKDGKINDEDKTYLGKPNPDWIFGLNLNLEYEGFDISMLWQGTLGSSIYDASRRSDLAAANYSTIWMDRWHGEGTSNRLPRLVYGNNDANNNGRVSDLYVFNGDYLRLKNVQLGYTFPKLMTRKANVDGLRLFVSAENLLTITRYHGSDPEVGSNFGLDKGIYPQARTFIFGASLTF
ncbi:MAG: TonB-dependent receptor [Prolixibacteraceae bacterium]